MNEKFTDQMFIDVIKKIAAKGLHIPTISSPYFKINGLGFLVTDYGIDRKLNALAGVIVDLKK